MCGASAPPSGHRKDTDPFVGLSFELSMYNYNRTSAIMTGAKPGC
jgi:hypothetical protein